MFALRPEADIWAGLQHVCFVLNIRQRTGHVQKI
jgi:hypothetical protein